MNQYTSLFRQKIINPGFKYKRKVKELAEKVEAIKPIFEKAGAAVKREEHADEDGEYHNKIGEFDRKLVIPEFINLFQNFGTRIVEEGNQEYEFEFKKQKHLINAICFPNILHHFKMTHKGSKLILLSTDDKLGRASKFQSKVIKALIMELYTN